METKDLTAQQLTFHHTDFNSQAKGTYPYLCLRMFVFRITKCIKGLKEKYVTTGVFIVTRFSVQFQGHIMFKGNRYSALYVTSRRVIFDANSTVLFQSNQAIKGGAIAIHGFSALVIHDSSYFLFENNTAARVGGGIY